METMTTTTILTENKIMQYILITTFCSPNSSQILPTFLPTQLHTLSLLSLKNKQQQKETYSGVGGGIFWYPLGQRHLQQEIPTIKKYIQGPKVAGGKTSNLPAGTTRRGEHVMERWERRKYSGEAREKVKPSGSCTVDRRRHSVAE